MTQSTFGPIPTAFYRGYELGNGINDWILIPRGNSPAAIKPTIYGNIAHIQPVGSNTYWEILVDAFRMGMDLTPKQFHTWWRLLLENIFVSDPSLYTNPISELALVEDKRAYALGGDDLTALVVTDPLTLGSTSFDITNADSFLVAEDLLLVVGTEPRNRGSDVIQLTSTPVTDTISFSNIRRGATGLTSEYVTGSYNVYKLEAAMREVFLQVPPDIGPAEEPSRGHFRTSIPFTFATNNTPLPVLE